jgi:hypothetical protein
MPGPKVKVSLTLAADVVDTIDRDARRTGQTRSGLAEQWLRYGASRAAERAIDDATAAYYASLSPEAREEDEAIARATSREATRVQFDAPPRKPARRSTRTRSR